MANGLVKGRAKHLNGGRSLNGVRQPGGKSQQQCKGRPDAHEPCQIPGRRPANPNIPLDLYQSPTTEEQLKRIIDYREPTGGF